MGIVQADKELKKLAKERENLLAKYEQAKANFYNAKKKIAECDKSITFYEKEITSEVEYIASHLGMPEDRVAELLLEKKKPSQIESEGQIENDRAEEVPLEEISSETINSQMQEEEGYISLGETEQVYQEENSNGNFGKFKNNVLPDLR